MSYLDTQSSISFGLAPSPGLSSESTGWNGVVNGGYDSVGNGPTPPPPNVGQTPASTLATTQNLVPAATLDQLNSINSKYYYSSNAPIVPTTNALDYMMSPTNSGVSPAVANNPAATQSRTSMGPNGELITSYTGADLKLLIECGATGKPNYYFELVECHTISVSSYRMKTPVRALGYTNPKGFARGLRTIAGTMVLTEMNVDVLITFLQNVMVQDSSKDSQVTKVDQLPPFNITMVFANEMGASSCRTISGVEFLNDGTVYSVQDLLTERTISWMAYDFTPLMPYNSTSSATNNNGSATTAESTPINSMQQNNLGTPVNTPTLYANNTTVYNV